MQQSCRSISTVTAAAWMARKQCFAAQCVPFVVVQWGKVWRLALTAQKCLIAPPSHPYIPTIQRHVAICWENSKGIIRLVGFRVTSYKVFCLFRQKLYFCNWRKWYRVCNTLILGCGVGNNSVPYGPDVPRWMSVFFNCFKLHYKIKQNIVSPILQFDPLFQCIEFYPAI